jgi:hypothetical protein
MWIALLLLAVSFAFGCSKSDTTTTGDVQPAPLLAATVSASVPVPMATAIATPNRPTAAERLVEIDRLLARPLTGTPESADERTLLRAERAALIGSGQVPSQSGNQAPAEPVQSNPAPMGQHSTTDAPSGQIVIATSSSSLPFLQQLTPTERDRYFQELWLQNSSLIDVNVNRGGLGWRRTGPNRQRANMRTNMRPPRSGSGARTR